MEEIKEKIGRLAEINAANELMEISEELRNERKTIVIYLKNENLIKLDKYGGLTFIGDNALECKELYLESFKSF